MDTDFILRAVPQRAADPGRLSTIRTSRASSTAASTEDGLPYFVMEYVEGRHRSTDCDARTALDARSACALFLKRLRRRRSTPTGIWSCIATSSPSNILVTAEGEPKLLDFGIAKLLQPDRRTPAADRTATALRLLTPDYASPEQVRGEPITTASDVYSLGVVLYELLTGRRPYRTTGAGRDEIARAICEQEPPQAQRARPPSRRETATTSS